MSTHQKMNSEIIGLLRITDSPTCSYAADRIEELEKEVAELKRVLGEAWTERDDLRLEVAELKAARPWAHLAELAEITAERDRLKTEVAELQEKLAVCSRMRPTRGDFKLLERELAEKEKEVAELKAALEREKAACDLEVRNANKAYADRVQVTAERDRLRAENAYLREWGGRCQQEMEHQARIAQDAARKDQP